MLFKARRMVVSNSSFDNPITLAQSRSHLLELYSHFCGGAKGLALAGWLSFARAFDISPGFLSAERCEEAFNESLPKSRTALADEVATLCFADFQGAMRHVATAVSEKQWKVEFAAEKAGRYRYKLKEAEKSHIPPDAEECLEALLSALQQKGPIAKKQPPAAASATDQAASGERAKPKDKGGEGSMGSSSAAREAQMRALRLALIGEESSGGTAVGANGGLDGVGDWCNGGTAAAGLRGRNSRRAANRKPGNGSSASTAHTVPRAAGYGPTAANGGGLGPTPPSGPVRVGTPSTSPRANGTESLTGGRSPRRFRVSSDQSASLHNGRSSIGPSPPTTPRSITPARPAPSSVDRGGGGAVGSTPASGAYASPRTAETTSASACGVRDTPGGGKGSLGATHGESRATACTGGTGGVVSRLRGASNNTRGHQANGASLGGMTAGHKEPQGASPPEFFQLSTRGVQPLSDVDFVHALLNVPGAASAAAGGGQSNTFGPRRGSVQAW